MKFKRIELIGFKSFADKTVVKFDDGITAIVGPNGCGKSNVADAIRWVLGEQSSKLLRGSSMQDVIFNGTQSRKSLSYCEVSLVLDNSDREIDLDYNEIVLTRKLYRSGESEYLINNNISRLKNITEILHDAGIGRDGYSIIGQGKVEQIVSSKPENRRGIFEEAAGISKFKEKKLESERKLERTRINLSRLRDILIEIERQLNPLKEQAEKAKKYLALKEELKSLEINNYIYQYDSAASNKQEISLRINALAEEIDNKQKDLDVTVANYNKNYDDIQKIDKTIKELYDQVVALTVSLERKNGETTIVRERLALLREEAERLNNELNSETQNIERAELLLKQKKNNIELNKTNIQTLEENSKKISQKYLSVVDQLAKSEDEAEINQQIMITALDKLSDIKANISKLTAEHSASLEKQAELIRKKSTLDARCKVKQDDIKAFDGNLETLSKEKNSLLSNLQIQNQIVEENTTLLSNLGADLNNYNTTLASMTARKNMLEDMQKNFDGFNGAVKHLLAQSERNAKLKESFVGVVANLMSVPEQFKSAIEMALGGSIQNIVTQNEEKAQSIIAYLKQNNFGRATFLPITALKPRNISSYISDIRSQKGYYGVASELISYDKSLSNIFENLLGSTVIVDNLVTAVQIAKQTRYAFKIVTLDGDVVNPQGSMTGGSKNKNAVSVLGRDQEITDLQTQIAKIKQQIELCISSQNDAKQKLTNAQNYSSQYTQKINEINIDISRANELKKQTVILLESYQSELEQITKELDAVNSKIVSIETTITELNHMQNSINGNKQDANNSIAKRQQDFDNLKKERDEYNEKMLDVKVKIASLNSEISSFEMDIERINQELLERNQKVEQINTMIVSNAETIKKAEMVVNATTNDADYVETNNKLTEVKTKLDNLGNYKNDLQSELKILDEDRLNLTTRLNKLQDKLFQENLNLTKVDTDIENMQERIWTEYGLNYSTALPLKRENYDLVEGLKQANTTKREIDRLGYINVNAIEDSKVYQERFDDYTTQIADMTKAEEDLTKIIKELATEMVTRFESSFNQVNINFGRIFKELFGGGNATLELVPTESGDVLDAGVDIKVEPPGKKLQSITLLSGGEKALTAIAILFAILKLRPMPFVLLDEIEAALDDANVGRFAKYLQKFSGETQFIVITHRKPTMELADNLYGVTMPEKGISTVVSVKLSEAIQVDRQSANA